MPFRLDFAPALLLLLLLPLLVRLGRPRLRYLPPARRWTALGLRLAGMALLAVALAGPSIRQPDDGLSVVYVVDTSDSLAPDTQAQAVDWLRRAEAARQPHDRSALVRVGAQAAALRPLAEASLGKQELAALTDASNQDSGNLSGDSQDTNLQAGLRLARALLPPSGPRRIVLLSDGWETMARADAEILPLAAAGIHVDAVPLAATPPRDLAVQSVDAPPVVREAEPVEASVAVYSATATDATVRLWVDTTAAGQQPIALQPGLNRVSLDTALRGAGLHRLSAEVVTDGGSAELAQAIVVKDPARVLVLEDRTDEAQPLASALQAAGLKVDVRHPTNNARPLDLGQLLPYDGVVLDNVAASTLTLDQLQALDTYVQNLGRGLTVVGGNTSYALGGYTGSLLEQALPLSADAPFQQERGTLAMVLVIDRSGSMSLRSDDVTKMAMAREAAVLATETLRPDDQLGVIAFDVRNDWIVPLNSITANGGLAAVQQAIGTIEADGGTDIYPALQRAYDAIAATDAQFKHVILLSDGQSWGSNWDSLLAQYRASGVTLSTIGIGQDIDANLMSLLARGGLGRYYFTDRVREIPRIMMRETNVVTRPVAMEGRVQPRLGADSPLLRSLSPSELPALNGYVVTTPKPTAEVALWSERGDPLLASWQYGLGRVAAWSADAGPAWSSEWLTWPRFGQFWSQIVRWTLAPPEQGDLRVLAQQQGHSGDGRSTQVQVTVEALREDGSFLDRAPTEARIRPPSQARGSTVARLPLQQVAPGRYENSFLAREPGVYGVDVVQQLPGGAERHELAGVTVPADPEHAHAGSNRALLGRLTHETGGRLLQDAKQVFARDASLRAAPQGERWDSLTPLLAALALLLFPLDVAARRLRLFGG
ncbi:MAG TPA: VWA domain-containing protein [Chloroflexota bacterium]|nr:VWA domain-containing protein [Chloroflexota bacterium]